ncbi:MAG: hypothetical protein ACLFR1_07620 [Spirochaetia bacterium]
MKKHTYLIAGLTLICMLFMSISCSGGAVEQEDADMAFSMSVGLYFVGSMAAAFGEEIEGISYDQQNQVLSIDNVNLTELIGEEDIQTPYETVSGTFTVTEETLEADLELTGGPVTSLKYEIAAEAIMESPTAEASVNGNTMTVSYSEE